MSKIKELAKVVREMVEARPDNKYLSEGVCYYSHGKCTDGSIGCLIAQCLPLVGIPLDPRWDNVEKQKGTGIRTILEEYYEDGDEDALYWIDYVQSNQDDGCTWKEAIEGADKVSSIDEEEF